MSLIALSWKATKVSRDIARMEALEGMLDKWSAICCVLVILVSVVQVPIIQPHSAYSKISIDSCCWFFIKMYFCPVWYHISILHWNCRCTVFAAVFLLPIPNWETWRLLHDKAHIWINFPILQSLKFWKSSLAFERDVAAGYLLATSWVLSSPYLPSEGSLPSEISLSSIQRESCLCKEDKEIFYLWCSY